MLGYRGGFWHEWINPHKCTFDGVNRLILVNHGVEDLDVQVDIYSDWKEWVQMYDNSKWLPAVSVIGGEPIPGGKVGATFFLINGWRIKSWKGDYRLNVQGNLYTAEGDNPFLPVSGVSVSSTVSDLNTTQVVQAPEVDAQAVWNYHTRNLSVAAGLTHEQAQQLTDTLSVLMTIVAPEAIKSRKLQSNKAVISTDDRLVTIYDDDGTTILHQFDVSADKRVRVPV